MAKRTAIVLDRDSARRYQIRQRLISCGILPICFGDEWIGLENVHHIRPALALYGCDNREQALRFTHIARAIRSTLPLVFVSDQSDVHRWVAHHWPDDLYFLKYPIDGRALKDVIAAMDLSQIRVERPVLVAGSPDSHKRIQSLPLLGDSREPLLIQGEAGVGKRLTAKAIHAWAMVDPADSEWIHAGNISEAWLGRWLRSLPATRQTPAKRRFWVIENIEQLSLELQGRLLPMLENSWDNPRSNGYRHLPRLIALAQTDLERLSRQGLFRQDLYHRISVLKLILPPLRDRPDDVPALADFFTALTANGRNGTVLRLPETVRRLLTTYNWPGNAAELRNAIEQSPLVRGARDKGLPGDWFADYIERHRHPFGPSSIDVNAELRQFLKNNRDSSLKRAKQHCGMQVEIRFMRAALSRTNGNCKKAARLLRISYKSMLNKAKAYHLVG